MNHYIFTVKTYVNDDFESVVEIDTFYRMESYDFLVNSKQDNPQSYYQSLCVLLGKEKVDEKYQGFEDALETDVNAYQHIQMRSTLNGGHMTMHSLTAKTSIGREELQVLIDVKKETGQLKTFLSDSRV